MISLNNSPVARAATKAMPSSASTASATKTRQYDFTSLSEQKQEQKQDQLNAKQKFYKKMLNIFDNGLTKVLDEFSPLFGLGVLTAALSTGSGLMFSLIYSVIPVLITKLNSKALVPLLNRKKEEHGDHEGKVNLNQDLVFDEKTKRDLYYKIKQFLGYKSELQTENLAKTVGTSSGNLLILHGPPGTGKTAIAEGIAGIAKKPLIKVNVNDIESKWIGESEKQIAQKFKIAEKTGAYLFFDEADALLMPRSDNNDSGGLISQTKITNTFIQNFNDKSDKVKVILATNTANSLDNAIKSRAILCSIPAPNREMQLAILYRKLSDFGLNQEHIQTIKTQEDQIKELLSKEFSHFTGRDIENAVKSAFFIAESRATESGNKVDFRIEDLKQALENLSLEKERSDNSELRVMSPKEQAQKSQAFKNLLGL